MTEVINIQITFLTENIAERDSVITHNGLKFSLETNNCSKAQLNLLNKNSLQVFIIHTKYGLNQYELDDLKYVNVKPLVVEITNTTHSPLKEIIGTKAHFMRFNEQTDFYENDQFKDKLVEMSLQNEDVLKSSIINSIFSEFLSEGKIQKVVVEDFCNENSLDLEECLEVLKESNYVFEHSDSYNFDRYEFINFIRILENDKNIFMNGLTTYEKLITKIPDYGIEFLETKNILIKTEDEYAFPYFKYPLDIHKNLTFIDLFPNQLAGKINLEFSVEFLLPFSSFIKEISKNRKITNVYLNNIILDDNILLVHQNGRIKIFFLDVYDLTIIEDISKLFEFINAIITVRFSYNLTWPNHFNFSYNEITKYVNGEPDFWNSRKIVEMKKDVVDDFLMVARDFYSKIKIKQQKLWN